MGSTREDFGMKKVNVAILGTSFMGRAHSNGWNQVKKFFSPEVEPVLKVACGRDPERTKEFADNWGWEETADNWEEVIQRDDIDIVDISLPQHLHHKAAIAAAKAGKHIFCEKPMALELSKAEEMMDAIQNYDKVHYINHNYRRLPAVQLAKKMIEAGQIGRIFHWRGAYQQDWVVDPNFPLTWHLQKELSGSGAMGDLNSHSVDLAHFLVGDIKSVSALTTTFIKERPLPGKGAATFSKGAVSEEKGEVTVDDASMMLVEFENGAVGSFEATRFATGRRNHNTFEIYGSKGSLVFDLERMNEIQFYNNEDPEGQQGFRTILATDPSHAYMKHWWPTAHNIGYEHSFVHAMTDFLDAIGTDGKIEPDFNDGIKVMRVLDASLRSAESGQRVYL